MDTTKNKFRGFDGFTLKMIAIVCMVIDHVAWIFFSPTTTVASGRFWMHVVGRVTFPIMAFFISEGYHHTRNANKYLLRLAIFSAISFLPYMLAFHQWFPNNIFITLFLGLLSLVLAEKTEDKMLKIIIVALCAIASSIGDWPVVGVPLIYIFGVIRERKKRVWIGLCSFVGLYLLNASLTKLTGGGFPLTRWCVLGAFLTAPLLLHYNGERGLSNVAVKYLFYWFYPLHLLILVFIRFAITGAW